MNSLHETTLPNLHNKCQLLSQAIVQHELNEPHARDIETVHLAIDVLLLPKLSSMIEKVAPGDLVAALERVEAAGLVEEANLVRAVIYRGRTDD